MPEGLAGAARRSNTDRPTRQLLGQVLVEADIISTVELEQALGAAAAWGVPLGQAVLALGLAKPIEFYPALAHHLGLPFVDVLNTPPPADHFDVNHLEFYLSAEAIPIGRTDEETGRRLILATPGPPGRRARDCPQTRAWATGAYGSTHLRHNTASRRAVDIAIPV